MKFINLGFYNDIEDLKMLGNETADDIISAMLSEQGHFYKLDDKSPCDEIGVLDLNPQFTTDKKYAVVYDIPTDMSKLEEYKNKGVDFFIDIYEVVDEDDDDTNEDGKPMTIKAMKNCLSVIRKDTESHIRELFEKYNIKELDCTECGYCPLVLPSANGDGSESYTLDRVEINDKNYGVIFHCSNCYDNDFVMVSDVPIEELIDILEWLETNIEDLIDE